MLAKHCRASCRRCSEREMPEATFAPNWAKSLGRINIREPSGDTADIVQAMLRLIDTTRPEVDRLLRQAVKQSCNEARVADPREATPSR